MKAFALLLAALALAWTVALSARAAPPPSHIVVVTDDRYPPYLFRGDDGELLGHTKEKWDAWSRETGVRVELRGTRWAVAPHVTVTAAEIPTVRQITRLNGPLWKISLKLSKLQVWTTFPVKESTLQNA